MLRAGEEVGRHGYSHTQEQGEASNVLIPLGSEQLHVNVIYSHWVVGQVHLLSHTVLSHLPERIYIETETRAWENYGRLKWCGFFLGHYTICDREYN